MGWFWGLVPPAERPRGCLWSNADTTAAVNALPASDKLASNSTVAPEHIWLLPLETELWVKRVQRRRLIKILNQTETRKYLRTAKELEQQGPDGSHLVNQPEIPEMVQTAPPKELPQQPGEFGPRLETFSGLYIKTRRAALSQTPRAPRIFFTSFCSSCLVPCSSPFSFGRKAFQTRALWLYGW
ncbi:ftsH [Symbiodinium sp. CCMP2592]|nr:ftsH [Symbiodinium sp. CCMP2592]